MSILLSNLAKPLGSGRDSNQGVLYGVPDPKGDGLRRSDGDHRRPGRRQLHGSCVSDRHPEAGSDLLRLEGRTGQAPSRAGLELIWLLCGTSVRRAAMVGRVRSLAGLVDARAFPRSLADRRLLALLGT